MAKAVLVGREAVMLLRAVQIGNSWFNAGEIHVFGSETARRLYSKGDARPHITSTRKQPPSPPPASEQDKQIVAAPTPASANRQLVSRPRISRRAVSKESMK
jgi:hypothetical protein